MRSFVFDYFYCLTSFITECYFLDPPPGIDNWFINELIYRSLLYTAIFTAIRLIPRRYLNKFYYNNAPVRLFLELEFAWIFTCYYFEVGQAFREKFGDTWTLYLLHLVLESYGGGAIGLLDRYLLKNNV